MTSTESRFQRADEAANGKSRGPFAAFPFLFFIYVMGIDLTKESTLTGAAAAQNKPSCRRRSFYKPRTISLEIGPYHNPT